MEIPSLCNDVVEYILHFVEPSVNVCLANKYFKQLLTNGSKTIVTNLERILDSWDGVIDYEWWWTHIHLGNKSANIKFRALCLLLNRAIEIQRFDFLDKKYVRAIIIDNKQEFTDKAIIYNLLPLLKFVHDKYFDVSCERQFIMELAAQHGNLEMFKFAEKLQTTCKQILRNASITFSIMKNQRHITRYIIDNKLEDCNWGNCDLVKAIQSNVTLEDIRWMIQNGAPLNYLALAIDWATHKNQTDIVHLLQNIFM